MWGCYISYDWKAFTSSETRLVCLLIVESIKWLFKYIYIYIKTTTKNDFDHEWVFQFRTQEDTIQRFKLQTPRDYLWFPLLSSGTQKCIFIRLGRKYGEREKNIAAFGTKDIETFWSEDTKGFKKTALINSAHLFTLSAGFHLQQQNTDALSQRRQHPSSSVYRAYESVIHLWANHDWDEI